MEGARLGRLSSDLALVCLGSGLGPPPASSVTLSPLLPEDFRLGQSFA